jgi:ankyrin repeat protein
VTVRFAFFGYGASRLVLRLGPDLANAAQLKGNVDAVMALVELGANINAKNSLGIYPIEAACMDGDDGNVAVVQFLCTLPTVSLTGFVYASVDKLENATGYDAGNFQMMGKALRDAGAPSDPTTP